MKSSVKSKLYQVFLECFPDAAIAPEAFSELEQGSFDQWDSLGNLVLLLAIEEVFDIRFSQTQLSEVQSVVQILKVLHANED